MNTHLNYIPGWFTKKRILLTVFIFSVFMLGTIFYWFNFQNKSLEKNYEDQMELSRQENQFEDLYFYIQSAESAIRGYTSSGNNNFAVNFNALLDSIKINHKELKKFRHPNNDSVNTILFADFDRLILQKVAFMQQLKSLCDSNKRDLAVELLSTEQGIMLTDSILKLNEVTKSSIRETILSSKNSYIGANRQNNYFANIGIGISLMLIMLVFYFLIREIRLSKKMSEELWIQKEKFKITLNSITEGLITTGKNAEILYMNPSAEKLTGWKMEEALHQKLHKIYNVVNEETGKPFENIVSRILSEGKTFDLENNTILHTKNAEKMIISNNGAPLIDAAGNITGAVLLFNNITEQKNAELELKDTEKRYKDLIQHLPEAVYTCDELGYIKLYNKAAVNLWGREPVIGKDLWCGSWKIFNKDGSELPLYDCPMAIALKEKRPVYGREIIVQKPDGSFRNILPSPTPIFNSVGKLTGAVNMLIDITDKKERDILVKKSEEKYRSLIDCATDAIMVYTFDGTIHETNKSICEMSGYTESEFSRLKLQDILVGDIIMSKEKYEGILEGKAVVLYRIFKRRDGSTIDMEIVSKLQPDGKVLGIGRDITERRKNEEKVRIAVERYDILAKATSDTIWDWDIVNDVIRYNDGMTLMFGYQQKELEKIAEWWKKHIHPDDKDFVTAKLDKLFAKGGNTIQMEYRYRCSDNTYKNILDRAYAVYDINGKPVRMIGAMQDITSEKEAAIRLAKAIIDTQENERQQIGMELHDNVNQLLSATLLYLGLAVTSNNEGKEITETVNYCKDFINEAIAENRRLSHRLAPCAKDEVSLKEVIESLVKPMSVTNQFAIELFVQEFDEELVSGELQINIYRIVQEQLNNIIKYAKAKKVKINVFLTKTEINLSIIDDGIGFNPDDLKTGIGLGNIKRRTEMFAGKLIINSSAGNGCELIVTLPLNAAT